MKPNGTPRAAALFLDAFDALSAAYLAHVDWEAVAALEARDGARLAEILKRHLRNKCETVKESLTAAM